MKLPTGIVAGLGRAGTTWIHRSLEQEPKCFTPPQKDINFFDRHYGRGIDWYSRHFEGSMSSVMVDVSHDYFFHPMAASRILESLQVCQVVVILRSPVTWVESVIVRETQLGLHKGLDPKDAICGNLGLVSASRYSDNILLWKKAFGDSLSVLFYEDLESDAATFYGNLADALQLANPSAPVVEKVNKRAVARSRSLNSSMRNFSRRLDDVGLGGISGRLKRLGAAQKILYSSKEDTPPRLDIEMRDSLYEWTHEDVFRLSEILEVNLLEKWEYEEQYF